MPKVIDFIDFEIFRNQVLLRNLDFLHAIRASDVIKREEVLNHANFIEVDLLQKLLALIANGEIELSPKLYNEMKQERLGENGPSLSEKLENEGNVKVFNEEFPKLTLHGKIMHLKMYLKY